MAFSVQRFRRVFSTPSTTRGIWVPSLEILDQIKAGLHDLKDELSPALVSLNTSFLSPSGNLRASGVFLAPNLIATSATAVGRFATSYEPLTVEKPDRFERCGRICTKPDIGSTVALTADGKTLETKPLAVNIANDLAVLEVEGENFPHLTLARSVPRVGEVLTAISLPPNYSRAIIMSAKVRATGERTIRVKAPWPLDDGSEWIEHDWFDSGDGSGKRPPLYNFGEKLTASIAKGGTGIPWFNRDSEIVGITSWQVGNDPTFYKVGFAVPSPVIRSVLEYAKTKGPDDPLVMEGCVTASS